MIRLGPILIGVSNNWKKMHGLPMDSTKRYPHERKDMPKSARVRYHRMKRAGCSDDLIARYLLDIDGFDLCKERKK